MGGGARKVGKVIYKDQVNIYSFRGERQITPIYKGGQPEITRIWAFRLFVEQVISVCAVRFLFP